MCRRCGRAGSRARRSCPRWCPSTPLCSPAALLPLKPPPRRPVRHHHRSQNLPQCGAQAAQSPAVATVVRRPVARSADRLPRLAHVRSSSRWCARTPTLRSPNAAESRVPVCHGRTCSSVRVAGVPLSRSRPSSSMPPRLAPACHVTTGFAVDSRESGETVVLRTVGSSVSHRT